MLPCNSRNVRGGDISHFGFLPSVRFRVSWFHRYYQPWMLHTTMFLGYVCNRLVGWLCWGLTSQSTIFQSCRDGAIASWVINQYFRGVKCLAQGHNTAAVGLEPRTSRSGVRHSTTEPPRSPQQVGNVLSFSDRDRGLGELWNTWIVGVFMAFIRVVYGRMIYMSLPVWAEIVKYYEECDWSKKWAEGLQKILTWKVFTDWT